MWTMFTCHPEFDSFTILKIFDEISGDINNFFFYLLLPNEMHRILENVQPNEPVFLKQPLHDVTKSQTGKRFKVQDKLMDFQVTRMKHSLIQCQI